MIKTHRYKHINKNVLQKQCIYNVRIYVAKLILMIGILTLI